MAEGHKLDIKCGRGGTSLIEYVRRKKKKEIGHCIPRNISRKMVIEFNCFLLLLLLIYLFTALLYPDTLRSLRMSLEVWRTRLKTRSIVI